MMERKHIATLLAFVAIASALVTGTVKAGDPPATDAGRKVAIFNYKFDPEVLTIPAGTTVTWTNKDEVPHTVVSSDKRFPQSSGLDTGETYSYKFTTAGSYAYFCTLHPFMKGKIVVTDTKPATSDSY